MTKQFRDVSKAGAVSRAYHDLASRHRARYHNIEVMSVKNIPNHEVTRSSVLQFHRASVSFPLLHRNRKATRKNRAIFVKKGSQRVVVA